MNELKELEEIEKEIEMLQELAESLREKSKNLSPIMNFLKKESLRLKNLLKESERLEVCIDENHYCPSIKIQSPKISEFYANISRYEYLDYEDVNHVYFNFYTRSREGYEEELKIIFKFFLEMEERFNNFIEKKEV